MMRADTTPSTSSSMASYPCAKLKLDQFFLQWLSEHQDLVSPLCTVGSLAAPPIPYTHQPHQPHHPAGSEPSR